MTETDTVRNRERLNSIERRRDMVDVQDRGFEIRPLDEFQNSPESNQNKSNEKAANLKFIKGINIKYLETYGKVNFLKKCNYIMQTARLYLIINSQYLRIKNFNDIIYL